MSQFTVKFLIYLIPFLKPEGWPNPVIHDTYVQAPDFASLKDAVDTSMTKFINQRGVIVLKPTSEHLGNNINTMNLRQFVPMHMIAYIDQETSRLVQPPLPEGVTEEFKN